MDSSHREAHHDASALVLLPQGAFLSKCRYGASLEPGARTVPTLIRAQFEPSRAFRATRGSPKAAKTQEIRQ